MRPSFKPVWTWCPVCTVRTYHARHDRYYRCGKCGCVHLGARIIEKGARDGSWHSN